MDIDLTKVVLRPLTRGELDVAVEWAAAEGWNPGQNDAETFWQTDPHGYVGAEHEGELVACGSTVAYDREFGFMGFFIVKPGLRHQGLGRRLWLWRRDTLVRRLAPGAAIGMDGVFTMQPFYTRGGFVFTHRNLRMAGFGAHDASPDPNVVPLERVPFEQVQELDQECFGFARQVFLRSWIRPAAGLASGYVKDGRLQGFAVARACRKGFKIGPLFARTEEAAEALFRSMSSFAADQPLFLDTPENNPAALTLAARHGMAEVFGCARMYHGTPPALPWRSIFGVTTFELG
jgi:GNAT superfamily N-acetyltransferase